MTWTTTSRSPVPELGRWLTDATRDRWYDIGFPGATDLDFPELDRFFSEHLLNNIGDPWDDGHGRNHTKEAERAVVDTIGDLFNAPPDRWGYVTTGTTEGTEHALLQAARELPNVRVYTSTAAHYSVVKAADKLRLPLTYVPTNPDDSMSIDDLGRILRRHRRQPAMIVATCGTTMTEAVDDVAAITRTCDSIGITRRRIHVDAALAGIPLALLADGAAPRFDFPAGATSIVVSGHKFLGTLEPCGVLVHATRPRFVGHGQVSYTGSADTTITGSRSGHTVLRLYTSLTRIGADGHRIRAEAARDLAAYTTKRLADIGWPHRRNPHAFTVVLDLPPAAVLDRWVLAHDDRQAHIITMPGLRHAQIDDFITDLQAATAPRLIPRQRRTPLAPKTKATT
jgi:histidine decarboxylase